MASACSGPRCSAHLSASTSQPACTPALVPRTARRPRARPAPLPPRVTNTQREIWDDNEHVKYLEAVSDPDNMKVVPVKVNPVWEPERGPMHERVSRTPQEEQFNDEISVVDTAYWFHTPPKGWAVEQRMPAAEEEEGEFPHPAHPEEELEWRFPFELMEEGMEVDGVVSDMWLYHGAQIDFIGEIDGLIPISQEQWRDVMEELLPGTQVRVRVHKLMDRTLYRWPVQLELLDEKIAPRIMDPDEYSCPANVGLLFDQGMTVEEVAKTLGRTYTPTTYMLEPDMATVASRMQYAYGWNEPDINGNPDGPYERLNSTPANQVAINEIGSAPADD